MWVAKMLSQLDVTFGIFLSVHVLVEKSKKKRKTRKTRKVKKSKSRKTMVFAIFTFFAIRFSQEK